MRIQKMPAAAGPVLVLVLALVTTVVSVSPTAGAVPSQPRDSVAGSGTVELVVEGLPESIVSAFELNVQARPGAKMRPRGQVSLEAFFTGAKVTCLEVRTVPISTPFMEATMNVVTTEHGLVTFQVSDGNPEGLPDFFSVRTFSDRSRRDCSRLAFGAYNVAGFVTTGDVDMVDAG